MRKLVLCFSALLCVSCSLDAGRMINMKQIQSNYPVVLYRNMSNGSIASVSIPFSFYIKKSSLTNIRLSIAEYYYGYNSVKYLTKEYADCWYGTSQIYAYKDDSLSVLRNNGKDKILSFKAMKCTINSLHYIDTAQCVQSKFAAYLERMKSEHKDTLHLGSIQQLKDANPELVNGLLQNDSVRFSFYYKGHYHYIKLPIEVK